MANNTSEKPRLNKLMLARATACSCVILFGVIFITPKRAANLFRGLQLMPASNFAHQPIPLGDPSSQGDPASSVRGIRFTIHPTGIDPKEIVLAPGRYRIAVDNRSGASEANIQLDKSTGNVLANTQIPSRKLSWKEVFQLTPGEYSLRLTVQPDRTAKIIVTNN